MKRWNKKAAPLLAGVKYNRNMIAVWCPYCRAYHFHGWDRPSNSDAEHRCAHCADPKSPFHSTGYYITVAPRVKGAL